MTAVTVCVTTRLVGAHTEVLTTRLVGEHTEVQEGSAAEIEIMTNALRAIEQALGHDDEIKTLQDDLVRLTARYEASVRDAANLRAKNARLVAGRTRLKGEKAALAAENARLTALLRYN